MNTKRTAIKISQTGLVVALFSIFSTTGSAIDYGKTMPLAAWGSAGQDKALQGNGLFLPQTPNQTAVGLDGQQRPIRVKNPNFPTYHEETPDGRIQSQGTAASTFISGTIEVGGQVLLSANTTDEHALKIVDGPGAGITTREPAYTIADVKAGRQPTVIPVTLPAAGIYTFVCQIHGPSVSFTVQAGHQNDPDQLKKREEKLFGGHRDQHAFFMDRNSAFYRLRPVNFMSDMLRTWYRGL